MKLIKSLVILLMLAGASIAYANPMIDVKANHQDNLTAYSNQDIVVTVTYDPGEGCYGYPTFWYVALKPSVLSGALYFFDIYLYGSRQWYQIPPGANILDYFTYYASSTHIGPLDLTSFSLPSATMANLYFMAVNNCHGRIMDGVPINVRNPGNACTDACWSAYIGCTMYNQSNCGFNYGRCLQNCQ